MNVTTAYRVTSSTAAAAFKAIKIAAENAKRGDRVSSAESCLGDAMAAFAAGDNVAAQNAAARSLSYSVGFFSVAWRVALGLSKKDLA